MEEMVPSGEDDKTEGDENIKGDNYVKIYDWLSIFMIYIKPKTVSYLLNTVFH